MMTTLEKAEKFAAKTLTEDGLIDIFAGIGMIMIGYFWLVDNTALSAIMPFALISLWKVVRQKVSEPRIGRVTPAKEKKSDIKTGRIVLLIILLTLAVGVISWALGGAGDIQGTGYYPLFAAGPSLLIATFAFFHGRHYRCPRFYGYATWLVAAAGITIWLGEGPAKAVMIGGIPFLLVGFVYFFKFLSTYPKASS
ncbi:MAG: hypothetical protein ACTSU8_04545 [Alphaproteobacteria bacterium]